MCCTWQQQEWSGALETVMVTVTMWRVAALVIEMVARLTMAMLVLALGIFMAISLLLSDFC